MPWPSERVTSYLSDNSGTHFDPNLVSIFLSSLDDMDAIRARYADDGADPHLLSFKDLPVPAPISSLLD
ncbi:hypothetical protein MCP1_10064 [Candidatus Terasakiella magnetica]|nr:hypothetical protein MCP1_10064 [Candidatus Terasakiella magnetica]